MISRYDPTTWQSQPDKNVFLHDWMFHAMVMGTSTPASARAQPLAKTLSGIPESLQLGTTDSVGPIRNTKLGGQPAQMATVQFDLLGNPGQLTAYQLSYHGRVFYFLTVINDLTLDLVPGEKAAIASIMASIRFI